MPYFFARCFSFVFSVCFALLFFFLMEDPGVCCTVSQIIFSPFYLELSLAKQGYEQLYRWASQGE